MIFWARSSGVATPQMFVVEGQGEAIWKSFAENILDAPETEISELSVFEQFLEADEKTAIHIAGRKAFGMTVRAMTQWVTISNRPGMKIDLDEFGAPIGPIH